MANSERDTLLGRRVCMALLIGFLCYRSTLGRSLYVLLSTGPKFTFAPFGFYYTLCCFPPLPACRRLSCVSLGLVLDWDVVVRGSVFRRRCMCLTRTLHLTQDFALLCCAADALLPLMWYCRVLLAATRLLLLFGCYPSVLFPCSHTLL